MPVSGHKGSATPAEQSLVALCGFEWSAGLGVWLDRDGTRWDDLADVIEECHAMADTGWRVVGPDA